MISTPAPESEPSTNNVKDEVAVIVEEAEGDTTGKSSFLFLPWLAATALLLLTVAI